MRAARLHAYGKPLVIDDVPRPTPGPGQVVIRVEGAGFCHSDLHIISGDIQINEVYERVKHGQVAGRAVLTPAS